VSITEAQLDQAIIAAARRYPDRVNPVIVFDEGVPCVYTDPEGEHCLIGESLADLGYELPPVDDARNTWSYKRLSFGDPALPQSGFANHVQRIADSRHDDNSRLTWGEVLQRAEERGVTP
jgi:hypothetical protein